MKIVRLLVLLLALACAARGGDDVARFRPVKVPPEEKRLMDLARLQEWRCSYELKRTCRSMMLIAEYYKDGVCMGDYLLSNGLIFDHQAKGDYELTGTISVAWHMDFHNLISTQDGTQDGALESEAVHLAAFRPWDEDVFWDSQPETRAATGKNAQRGMGFKLYPVIGICGGKGLNLYKYPGYMTTPGGAKNFLGRCKSIGAKDAVVIYLYFSNGEQPCMDFKKSPPPGSPEGKP